MLLAVDLYEYFIDEEGVAVTSVFSFQSTGINRSELDAREADGLSANGYASLSEKILYITMAQIEAII